LGDGGIGAMIVASSATQAREIYSRLQVLEQDISAALVLYDEGTAVTRKNIQRDFKTGSIDILVVYNMLLTGFDASRLKKLYLCRVIEAHNLLQCLTRVNRPYNDFSFGYIVDFAGIEEEFDKTNQAYFKELQLELGDAVQQYSSLFEDPEKITQELQMIKRVLFEFNIENVVNFIKQIDAISNKEALYQLRSALKRYRELHNVAKMYGFFELLEKFDVFKAGELLNEVDNRINAINLKEALALEEMSTGNLNIALQNIEFHFQKIGTEELHIADEFEDKLRKTYAAFAQTLDVDDPEYILLMDELREKFKQVNIEELTSTEMKAQMIELDRLKARIDDLNNRDANLCQRYGADEKFLRVHKKLLRTPPPITTDKLMAFEILHAVKAQTDSVVENNESVLDNEPYFKDQVLRILKQTCEAHHQQPSYDQINTVGDFIAEEYQQERRKAS
jgi:type I restriction enzyme R subunit